MAFCFSIFGDEVKPGLSHLKSLSSLVSFDFVSMIIELDGYYGVLSTR